MNIIELYLATKIIIIHPLYTEIVARKSALCLKLDYDFVESTHFIHVYKLCKGTGFCLDYGPFCLVPKCQKTSNSCSVASASPLAATLFYYVRLDYFTSIVYSRGFIT